MANEKIRNIARAKDKCCIWVTGMPASGKSTISRKLVEKLQGKFKIGLYESDIFRKQDGNRLSYSPEDRDQFYRKFLNNLITMSNSFDVIIIDATGNNIKYREHAKNYFSNYFELYIYSSAITRLERDPKGLYQACMRGYKPYLPIYPIGDTLSPVQISHDLDREFISAKFKMFGVYDVNPFPDFIYISEDSFDDEFVIDSVYNKISEIRYH